jgi:hypothetical protein
LLKGLVTFYQIFAKKIDAKLNANNLREYFSIIGIACHNQVYRAAAIYAIMS